VPGAIQRHAHDARLLGQRLEDRLADPPYGVRDELDAFGLVELVCRADQAEVALMIRSESERLILILLGDGHDEPQVSSARAVERLWILLLIAARA